MMESPGEERQGDPEGVLLDQRPQSVVEFARKIQAVVEDLAKDRGGDKTEELLEDVALLIDDFPSNISGSSSSPQDSRPYQNTFDTAIALWNLAVTLKANPLVSEDAMSINAQMRHASCRLASLCMLAIPSSASTYMKLVQMSSKTARAWMDAGNPSLAEASLLLASEFHRKHYEACALENDTDRSETPDKLKVILEKQQLKIMLQEVEVVSALDQQQRALDKLAEAKDLLRRHPKQVLAAVLLTYNLGVACYRQYNFLLTITWLNESYDMGKGLEKMDRSKQARTLRLLARSYMEIGDEMDLRKAVNALDLANAEHSHPAGLYCKLSVLLKMKSDDGLVKQASMEYVSHSDVSLDMALAAAKELVEHDRVPLAVLGLQHLTARYRNSPSEVKLQLELLELLMQLDRVQEAGHVVDHCLTDLQPLTVKDRQQLHTILWTAGARAFDKGKHDMALTWYDYSADFFSSSELETKNASKLQRNRCLCLVEINRFEEAALAIQQAQQSDPDNPYSHFLLFKIALTKGESEEAVDQLKTMVQSGSKGSRESVREEDVFGLISLAAQLAFEKSHRHIAMHALEGLIQYSPNNKQVLVALRCLVRLKCTFLADSKASDLASLVFYIKTAYEKLQSMVGEQPDDYTRSEATWFMKMAWNTALQSSEAVEELHSLFVLCHKICQFLPPDNALLARQKTCQLMAAAALLQLAREAPGKECRDMHLRETLDHIKECQGICTLLSKRQLTRNASGDMAQVLLLLYEFECNSKLCLGGLQNILDTLADMELPDGGTFETVASLAVDCPGKNKQVAMNALRLALGKHLGRAPPDITKYSKAAHSLVHLALQSDGGVRLEEALQIYDSIADIWKDDVNKSVYPEMEIVWLMTKAWNTGIKQFSSMKYVEAERWCSLGLSLLERLTSMKVNYESQMATAYTEVLSKIEAYKAVGGAEE